MVISAKNLNNEYDGLQQNYDLHKTVTILVYQFPVLPPPCYISQISLAIRPLRHKRTPRHHLR